MMNGANLAAQDEVPAALNFEMKTLSGKEIHLKEFQGKVVMFVNVASKCGFTRQYEQLQDLHKKYGEKGLVVIGVPCNQFGGQEPGTAEEIQEFCSSTYGVEFPMLEKVDVNGDDQCGLYKYLTAQETEPAGAGKVKWNFEKFLIGRDGSVLARFGSRTSPDDEQVIKMIEAQLDAQK